MPTVLRDGPYRFFFYSADRAEPPHVHVERDDKQLKAWIDPVRLARNIGFRKREVRTVLALIREHQELLLRVWHDEFDDR
jgi:hypothetical protein